MEFKKREKNNGVSTFDNIGFIGFGERLLRKTHERLYPLFQGSALTMSTIMSAVFFNERLNVKCIVGILISFIALIIINVL